MSLRHRILIIEDDPDTIQLLEVVLRTGGYEPVAAIGGRAGLACLRETEVSLVLLDLMMDDVDGWTVLRTIKQDPAYAELPVVVLSVKNPLEDPRLVKAHRELFADYIVKPFNVRELLGRVGSLVEGVEVPADSPSNAPAGLQSGVGTGAQ